MTFEFSIRHNFPEVQSQIRRLREDVAARATASAINKTLAQGQTRMVRTITAEFNISARAVREALRISRASFRQGLFEMSGYLESPSKRGRSLNLIRFDAKQTRLGVTFKIKRGGPRQTIRGAFIANKDNSAGGTVFIREGKARLPIAAKQTIDIAQMFNTKRVNERVREFIAAKFPEIWESESKFFVDRFNATRAGAESGWVKQGGAWYRR